MLNFQNTYNYYNRHIRVNQNGDDNMFMQVYPFKNVPLPYPYNAYEPYIDEKTMQLHHNRHLQGYIDHLNMALAEAGEYQSLTLIDLIKAAPSMPEPLKTQISRNAGGVFNHFFYFFQLTPSGTKPSGPILNFINKYFSSFENFVKQFTDAAMSVFGSGYAYLVLDEDGMAKIVTTKNQTTPLTADMTPLLNIDVWEHAYYLKHYNERAAYIKDWFNLVDWEKLNSRI